MTERDERLLELVEAAPEYEPKSSGGREVRELIDATANGSRRAIAWPFHLLSKLTRSLSPGTITELVGSPAATKTLMVMQAAAHWHSLGIPVAYYALEDSRAFHLNRALAQRCGLADLTDDEFIRANPDVARKAAENNRAWLDSFGRCIHEKPRTRVKLIEAGNWIRDQAKAGKRIVILDPLMACATGSQRWIDDGAFVDCIKIAAEDHGASVVIVNHLDLVTGKARGGQIYEQLAHTVLVIKAQDPEKMRVVLPHITEETDINRLITIQKARLASGTGATIGFWFDSKSLTFRECGTVSKKKSMNGGRS